MAESLAAATPQKNTQPKTALHSTPGEPAVTSAYGAILSLQQSVGNRTLSQLLQSELTSRHSSSAVLQRKCSDCDSGGSPCNSCRDSDEARLQKAPDSGAGAGWRAGDNAPPIVHDVLRSSGNPLEPSTRQLMENRFGHDFTSVRVHVGRRAADSAAAVGALAYTVGNHVVFGSGQYSPVSGRGQDLLAHELTHVVQQGRASIGGSIRIGPHDGAAEHEAHSIGSGIRRHPTQLSRALLQRQPTAGCRRLLSRPGLSDPLTGI